MGTEPRAGTRIVDRGSQGSVVAVRAARAVHGDLSVAIGLTSLVVGSGQDAGLTIADPTVSARHLELRMVDRGCSVRDLGSRNGTRIGAVMVNEIVLTESATLSLGEATLRVELGDGEAELPLARATNFGGLLGHGPAMRAAFAIFEKVAKTDSTVLVTGESGTGKELAARAIHERSPRAAGPFVVFDCAAVSPTLVESQLFGHARGSYTGATDARAGVFEQAHGGTLVLDELGELPLELQPKLLRALESRTVQRLGESKPREVDVRFVACTHRDLSEQVRLGRFREDLFFRLSVIAIRMPPLRERRDEIPRLVAHFRKKLGGATAPDFPEELMRALAQHDWPGNVRELRNVVERALALPGVDPAALIGRGLRPSTAEAAGNEPPKAPADDRAWELPFHDAKARLTDDFEREYLSKLLARHGGNVSEAARVAGLSRQSCYRLMHKHGFRVDE